MSDTAPAPESTLADQIEHPAPDAVVDPLPAPAAVPFPEPVPPVAPSLPTQVKRPWRATVRTIFAALVGIASLAPFAYAAATKQDPAAASGDAAFALGVAAAITRILAVPAVEAWLQKWLPWLSADTPDWHAAL